MKELEQGHEQQAEFLNRFPIEKLRNLTIEEYTNLKKENSFTYWLESKTYFNGSIWGGSSFKFGIFKRNNTESEVTLPHQTDGEYSWHSKYGETKDEAFQTIRNILVDIATNSLSGELERIDSIDLGDAYKWKIAFLYNPSSLIPIYSRKNLELAYEGVTSKSGNGLAISEMQRELIATKPEELSTLEYGKSLWSKYDPRMIFPSIEKFIRQSETDNLKRQGFPKTYMDLKMSVSFGAGASARVPWIAFLGEYDKVTEGIYPVYLLYKEVGQLVLAYGRSDTNQSRRKWPNESDLNNIKDWYISLYDKEPPRYGESYIHSVYNLVDELDPELLQNDLEKIIQQYKELPAPKKSSEEIEDISRKRKVWLIAPGEGASEWDRFYKKGIVGLGWNEINQSLLDFENREALRLTLVETRDSESSQRNNSLALWEFSRIMAPGDIIIAKKGRSEYVGYGIVNSGYQFVTGDEYPHQRLVDWKKKGSWEEEVHPIVTKTLTDISKYPDYVERLSKQLGIDGYQAENKSKTKNYWWLNANPSIWRIDETILNEEQYYTSRNEKGNKRRVYEYFTKVQPGDLVVGYASTPVKKVVAILEITQALHKDEDTDEEQFSFKTIHLLPKPIPWNDLKNHEHLKNCEVFKNNQGSLFRLSHEEFQSITSGQEIEKEPYTIKQALDGLFMKEGAFLSIKKSLIHKKNIILKGPPGTGKTFIAKRLAYALMEEKDDSRVEMIQFHQSYSYEDFMQGFRPTKEGTFRLNNGVFFRFCKKAQNDPDNDYVFIIDEINRGNLSKIFGELMMLIEADKRGEKFAVSLTYSDVISGKFFVPKNLHIIGTMNTADRSLAIIDYALRRRFSFHDMKPSFGDSFKKHLLDNGVDEGIIEKIESRLINLNHYILNDKNLGDGFEIGHSYFCHVQSGSGGQEWYDFIIQHEIAPLIREYWFDNDSEYEKQLEALNR